MDPFQDEHQPPHHRVTNTGAHVDLPHDWAIAGPFLTEGPHGSMGRLPSWGFGWYRKHERWRFRLRHGTRV